LDTTTIFGTPPVYSDSVSGFQYLDSIGNTFSVLPTHTLTDTLGNPAGSTITSGKYKIVPSGASLIAPANYTLNYVKGNLVVNKTPLTVTVRDTSRVYGDPNPVFAISYSGFLTGDDPSKITPPVASTTATATTPVGTYPITLTGGSSGNYAMQTTGGTLTITPAPLTVKANDAGISSGDKLPAFTSTITGFKNGESNTVISGPLYTVSPTFVSNNPGTYTVTPYNLKLTYQNNYAISYQTGTLYVNNKNGKNVVPKLDCVEPLVNDPSGFAYAANFSYNNPNATAVYVAVGDNNLIATSGRYSGQPPAVFLVGSGQFRIYFDGSKLTWTLITYNGNHSTSVAAVASSTSSKCSSGTGTLSAGEQSSNSTLEIVALTDSAGVKDSVVLTDPEAAVYPNPTKGYVTINLKTGSVTSNTMPITDVYGKLYEAASKELSAHSVKVDLSRLSTGMYFIRVQVDKQWRVFRVIKI
jgi:hypothetical protein